MGAMIAVEELNCRESADKRVAAGTILGAGKERMRGARGGIHKEQEVERDVKRSRRREYSQAHQCRNWKGICGV